MPKTGDEAGRVASASGDPLREARSNCKQADRRPQIIQLRRVGDRGNICGVMLPRAIVRAK